jgi:hypothetical protein
VLVYYEAIKRELYRRLIYECRCYERLQAKAEGFTRLAYARFSWWDCLLDPWDWVSRHFEYLKSVLREGEKAIA